jgi:cyclic pyranopterin phosphate synthase
VSRIGAIWPVEPVDAARPGEVAKRYRYLDGGGEFGVISSVTQPFCRTCGRARLSPEGQLYTCLFGRRGTDLRAPLRQGASDDEVRALLERTWRRRADRYSEVRTANAEPPADRVEMSHIGG